MECKITLEDHFSTAANNEHWDAKGEDARNGVGYTHDVGQRLLDVDGCVAEMDRAGVEMCVLSLTSPGVQSVVDPKRAAALARSSNDHAHQLARRYPGRLSAFAAVSLRDAAGAALELERAVTELGLVGVLVNGFTNVGAGEEVAYLDEAPLDEFWEMVAKLRVPLYLHPREPLPSQTRSIRGYPELVGSAWGFGYETASHAVRLMLSGLFDRYPDLQIILGHLGEGLPFLLPRLQHRLDEQREGVKGSKAKRRASYYFANNFHVTTSGFFHTKQLMDTLAQLGPDRVLFSTDYPYEQMDSAARWFDDLQLEWRIKRKVGRENAAGLLRLKLAPASRASVEAFAS